MTLQPHSLHARPLPESAASDRATPREDAIWSRPVFRPPPLDIRPAHLDLFYLGTSQRTEPWAPWPRESASAK